MAETTAVMFQAQETLTFRTSGRALVEITEDIRAWTAKAGISSGLLTLYLRHTSASLLIQENVDDDVLRDLRDFFGRLAPNDTDLYRHVAEGPDDMPAHIRSAVTQTHLAIPVADGELLLGTWQGIFLFEHRAKPHERKLVLHLLGA